MTKDNLAILFPEQTLEVAGVKYNLRPFPFGAIPTVIKTLSAVAAEISGINLEDIQMDEKGVSVTPETFQQFFNIALNHFSDLTTLICISIPDLSPQQIEDLPPDVGIQLAIAVFNVNKSFFTQRVLPLIPERTLAKMKQVQKEMKVVGEKS